MLMSHFLKSCLEMGFDNLVMDHKGMIKSQTEDRKQSLCLGQLIGECAKCFAQSPPQVFQGKKQLNTTSLFHVLFKSAFSSPG